MAGKPIISESSDNNDNEANLEPCKLCGIKLGNFKATFYLNTVLKFDTSASILRKITFYRFYPY